MNASRPLPPAACGGTYMFCLANFQLSFRMRLIGAAARRTPISRIGIGLSASAKRVLYRF